MATCGSGSRSGETLQTSAMAVQDRPACLSGRGEEIPGTERLSGTTGKGRETPRVFERRDGVKGRQRQGQRHLVKCPDVEPL